MGNYHRSDAAVSSSKLGIGHWDWVGRDGRKVKW